MATRPTSSYPARIRDITQNPQRQTIAGVLRDTATELTDGRNPAIIAQRLVNLANAIDPQP